MYVCNAPIFTFSTSFPLPFFPYNSRVVEELLDYTRMIDRWHQTSVFHFLRYSSEISSPLPSFASKGLRGEGKEKEKKTSPLVGRVYTVRE